ncbi:threonylcarbamoyl-AMP synthase [Psychrosphaera sp. B3R10]|uniref:L-threonylcarbamoyladenylate synthase n=1 Tax=unclassified Psychrosphaera TaxID=2641570 RepID=UPI001C0912FE|nr:MULTISPECIES: L-threonylcarbamoyladenylate synthase [unclassified Psychrosphaera]MBU2882391.1 threonylcarbamoyl-AMP synthase [Psychrosphaera sp. I2R16]MBU2989072.1 threonylcarbamoyl-AMP synthase [Psychrosphaera sp. B3R10]MDO6718068.1 L-threonylcarbamoyladenylate synthase [Psychrosphaera sp. 1_MG-2023]
MSQFFHIHPDNPQGRLISQAVAIVRNGGVIIYPTDSGYAIGCGLGEKKAMDRIISIRRVDKNHNFTLVCKDLSEIANFARVDNSAFRIIRHLTPGPFTFIFKGTKEVPKRVLNDKRRTIGIRVPNNKIALALLEELGEPLMSSSLLLPGDEFAESDPDEMRLRLEKHVDLIIHGGFLGEKPTSVVDFTDGEPVVLRRGEGDTSHFD